MAASEEEMEEIVETLTEAAQEAINDSVKFSQGESADMWARIAEDARRWEQLIRSEMEGGDDDESGDG